MNIFAKICGIIGLLLISYGIFSKKEVTQDKIFALGGLFLLLYSIYLRDPIFIILQGIFILSCLYEMYKIRHKKLLEGVFK